VRGVARERSSDLRRAELNAKLRTDAISGRVPAVFAGWGVSLFLLACIVAASSLAPAGLQDSSDLGLRAFLVGVAAISLQSLALLQLRRSPAWALVVVSVVAPAAAAAGLGIATGVTSVAVMIAVYAVVVDTPWPQPVPALGTAMLLVGLGDLVQAVRDDGWTFGAVGAASLQGVGTVGAAAVVGAVVNQRRESARARVDRIRALAGEQVALTQAAVARERVAMARELHDIAAHHLSGIAVMTAALDRQIDTDPAGAKAAVRQVREQSTAMLKDLRSLVALLREDDPRHAGLDVEPETLAGIPALVETARAAGREVQFSVDGADASWITSPGIGPLAQLAAYRTVQESLANAARHAPGARCEVVIDAGDPTQVVVVVRNEAPPQRERGAGPVATAPGGGFGIVGMQERADLTDAQLSAAPTPEGGWAVRLTIPTETMEERP
jgi:signal transduction histidine kinase